jgi:SAM-dependent methyltransferase
MTATATTQPFAMLQHELDQRLAGRPGLRVLEAGCGSISRLRFPDDSYLTGIDVSEVQLRNNPYLRERLHGDIETYDLPASSYDVIVCWNVFEHLPHPERALARFCDAVKPGGLVVLVFPNPLSVKGLVTKWTPFWVHVWVTRHLIGRKLAGTEGNPPYPTFMRWSAAPDALIRFAAERGLAPVFLSLFEDHKQRQIRQKVRITGARWRLIQRAVRVLTFGRIATDRAQCALLLQKSGTVLGS